MQTSQRVRVSIAETSGHITDGEWITVYYRLVYRTHYADAMQYTFGNMIKLTPLCAAPGQQRCNFPKSVRFVRRSIRGWIVAIYTTKDSVTFHERIRKLFRYYNNLCDITRNSIKIEKLSLKNLSRYVVCWFLRQCYFSLYSRIFSSRRIRQKRNIKQVARNHIDQIHAFRKSSIIQIHE